MADRLCIAALLVALATAAGCGSGGDDGGPAAAAPPVPIPAHLCGGETFASPIFATATINGQDGWFVDPAGGFDEGIVALGSGACRGNGVWKLNNAVTSGAFGNQPVSPAFPQSAGESSVRSAGGGDTMVVSFFFRAVSPTADGSTFTHSFSPTSSDRHTYLRFTNDLDANGGFRIISIDGVLLDQTHSFASNLSRTAWHHVRIVNLNVDGLAPGSIANDVVSIWIDGTLAGTFSTWESWRVALPAATLAVTRSLFRLSIAAASVDPSFTSPQGFYLDDYVQQVLDSSSPATILESYKTGFEVP
ncbi:MAG: hypothetical protein ABI654_11390 [Betaproteobacteria bacterium]